MFENFNDVAATGDVLVTALIIGVLFGIMGTIAFYSFIYAKDK